MTMKKLNVSNLSQKHQTWYNNHIKWILQWLPLLCKNVHDRLDLLSKQSNKPSNCQKYYDLLGEIMVLFSINLPNNMFQSIIKSENIFLWEILFGEKDLVIDKLKVDETVEFLLDYCKESLPVVHYVTVDIIKYWCLLFAIYVSLKKKQVLLLMNYFEVVSI